MSKASHAVKQNLDPFTIIVGQLQHKVVYSFASGHRCVDYH